jgi:hypothetical protein
MAIRRDPRGPLRFSTLIQYVDCFFWDKTRPPPVDPRDTDEPYIIKVQDRYDFLAARDLQTSRAGHLIMERNDMRLWPNDFVPGKRIKIPTRASLEDRGLL